MVASSELAACWGPAVLHCHGGAETCSGRLAGLVLADRATNDLPICETQMFTPWKTEPVGFAEWDTEALEDQSSFFLRQFWIYLFNDAGRQL